MAFKSPVYMENHEGTANKYYLMYQMDNGNFRTYHAGIGNAPQKHDYPIGDWDKKYDEKNKKGYKPMPIPSHISGLSSSLLDQIKKGTPAAPAAAPTPSVPKPVVAKPAPVAGNKEHEKKLEAVITIIKNSTKNVDDFDINAAMDIRRRFKRTGQLTVGDMKELNRLYQTYR